MAKTSFPVSILRAAASLGPAAAITRRASRPTRDDPACLVGYTCYEPSRDDWPGSDF